MIDLELLKFATEKQKKYLEAVEEHGSNNKAAKALGVGRRTIDISITALKRKAAMSGYSPEHDMTRTVPNPFVLKGTSTLYDKEGNMALQWVKTSLDRERYDAAVREYCEYLVEDVRGKAQPIPPPKFSNSDLLSVYGIGDPHVGLYAWKAETGADFDLTIAEDLNVGAFARLVSVAPDSEEALIIEAGDLLHADDSSNMTPTSGNVLDVDSRYAKVVQVALRILKRAVDLALAKHKKVTVWIVGGNHDPHSSFMVALCLNAFYSNEPRVVIDLSPAQYRYLLFGKVLIGAAHGHGAKAEQLPQRMAHDMAPEWGVSLFRYWYLGHIHHTVVKEIGGVIIEYLRTMAARDAWHALKGYLAGRDMKLFIHHKSFGEIERHTANVAMLQKEST